MAYASVFLLVIVLVMGAVGGSTPAQEADSVAVYSSLPFRGADKGHARAVERGIRLALEDAQGHAGLFDVRYHSLDGATRQARVGPGSRGPERAPGGLG